MQRVHTLICLVCPFTNALTLCRFGSQRLLVWLLAWLTLQPVEGFLPQISHIKDI